MSHILATTCYVSGMKATIHARLALAERRRRSALQLAGASVGRFKKGPSDLSANRKHLEGFGE